MTSRRLVAAELRKAASLPATAAAFVGAVLGTIGLALLNALSMRGALASGQADTLFSTDPADAVFTSVPLGTVGIVVIAMVGIGSEYAANSSGAGRQITTTFLAAPRRMRLLTAKAVTVVLLTVSAAASALPASFAVAYAVVGGHGRTSPGEVVARSLGTTLYWTLTALIAMSIATLTRGGIVPLIVMVANSAVVWVSLLLSQLTPLARYLPDLAGGRLFANHDLIAVDDALGPMVGGLVMTGWAAALLGIAAVIFVRRDA